MIHQGTCAQGSTRVIWSGPGQLRTWKTCGNMSSRIFLDVNSKRLVLSVPNRQNTPNLESQEEERSAIRISPYQRGLIVFPHVVLLVMENDSIATWVRAPRVGPLFYDRTTQTGVHSFSNRLLEIHVEHDPGRERRDIQGGPHSAT